MLQSENPLIEENKDTLSTAAEVCVAAIEKLYPEMTEGSQRDDIEAICTMEINNRISKHAQ